MLIEIDYKNGHFETYTCFCSHLER